MSDIYAENHQNAPVDLLSPPRGMTMERFQAVVWRLANLYPVRTLLCTNYSNEPKEPQHLVIQFGLHPENPALKPSAELLEELAAMGFTWNGYGWKIDRTPDESPWQPISTAPKDGTSVLLKTKAPIPSRDDLQCYSNIQFVGKHNGIAADGFDEGWNFAAPVGCGGIPDEWLEGWISLDRISPNAGAALQESPVK